MAIGWHSPLDSTYDPEKKQTTTHMDFGLCQACPLRESCPMTGKRSRTFRHTAPERRRAERRKHEETDAFKDLYRKRAGIEGTNSGIKRRTGLARLRVRGAPAVFMAVRLKVAGWNILRAASAEKMRLYIAEIIESRSTKPPNKPMRGKIRASGAHETVFWTSITPVALIGGGPLCPQAF